MRFYDLLRIILRGRISGNSGTTGYEPKCIHILLTCNQYLLKSDAVYLIVFFIVMMILWDMFHIQPYASLMMDCDSKSMIFVRSFHSYPSMALKQYSSSNKCLGSIIKCQDILYRHHQDREINDQWLCPVLRHCYDEWYSFPTGVISWGPTKWMILHHSVNWEWMLWHPVNQEWIFFGLTNTSMNKIRS